MEVFCCVLHWQRLPAATWGRDSEAGLEERPHPSPGSGAQRAPGPRANALLAGQPGGRRSGSVAGAPFGAAGKWTSVFCFGEGV